MTKIRLRDEAVPPSLRGWILVYRNGIPRYWANVWASLDAAKMKDPTLSGHLSSIEQFYLSVNQQLGNDCLDNLINCLDFERLESCLEGHFTKLRNLSGQSKDSDSNGWYSVIRFVRNCVERLSRGGGVRTPLDEIHARLLRLERLYQSLNVRRDVKPIVVRALPAEVLDDLYELINPESSRNPFRTINLRWRNFALVLLLLHQGLRRGETLVLAQDAIKVASAPGSSGVRRWINVADNEYEETDLRSDNPSLKNGYAIRQVPIGESVFSVIDTYLKNYRGKPSHSYMFSSQMNLALSKRSVNDLFVVLSKNLSTPAKKALMDQRKTDRIKPHDLRHTCAAIKMHQYIDMGVEMESAVQKLRVVFGWSHSSRMPQHYARAYFEVRAAAVWQESFEQHVNSLRLLDERHFQS